MFPSAPSWDGSSVGQGDFVFPKEDLVSAGDFLAAKPICHTTVCSGRWFVRREVDRL
jgi:hypothetical protein